MLVSTNTVWLTNAIDSPSNSYLATNYLNETQLVDSHVTNEEIVDYVTSTNTSTNTNWSGLDFSSPALEGLNLAGLNLNGYDLSAANLRGVNLVYANLQSANLSNANLVGASLTGASFTSANLVNAEVSFSGYNHLAAQGLEGYYSDDFQKHLASDGTSNDNFGYSVSLSGDYAIAGARRDDDNGDDSGSAYIFFRNGVNWTQQAKLTANDGASGDNFGQSVSLSGYYAIVGAHTDTSNVINGNDTNMVTHGSAYIFFRNGTNWTQQAKLTADDGTNEDFFGYFVSLSGNYAIVGAYWDDDNGSASGSAYIFVRDGVNWTQQAKLTANDGASSDQFGGSVSISGDYAAIGAFGDDDSGNSSGSAYIFNRSGNSWTQQAKLTANDGASGDNFGQFASISGDYAIVGAAGDDDNGSASGSAYIFFRNGTNWTQQAKLTANDGASGDSFGRFVSISGDYAIVGARGDDSSRGASYIFARNGSSWTQTKIIPNDGANGDQFGWSISSSGDYAIVGAYTDTDNGNESGSAYIVKFR